MIYELSETALRPFKKARKTDFLIPEYGSPVQRNSENFIKMNAYFWRLFN